MELVGGVLAVGVRSSGTYTIMLCNLLLGLGGRVLIPYCLGKVVGYLLLGLGGGVLVVGVLVWLGGGVLVVAVRWWGSCCWG